jgi:hypothetical protein
MARPCLVRLQLRTPACARVCVRVTVGIAATAVAGVVAGCATVPSGGPPQQVKTGGTEIQAYLESLPPPGPSAYSQPREVVLGFLHASASYAFDPDAARQFLLPGLRASWHPGPVTVVSSVTVKPATQQDHSQLDASSAAGPSEVVRLTGQRLATLSKTGQYQYQRRTSTYGFTLQKVNGVWLISQPPPGLLLLQADFERVYQPRNLFFFAQPPAPANGELVPDAVYAPLQNSVSALNTNLARELVTGLLNDDHGWLSGATRTFFPPRTKLIGVRFSGQTAIVTLGGAAVRASPIEKQDMIEQLYATLSSTAYSTPLAHAVQMKINGSATTISSLPNGTLSEVTRGPVVYQSGVYTLAEGLGRSPSLGPWESGSAVISAIAADPAVAAATQLPPMAVAVADGRGCAVYLRTMQNEELTGPYHRFPLSTTGGNCTSLSWDGNGNVWAAAGRKLWVLVLNAAQQWRALPIALPANLTSSGQPAPQVLAVQVAPDAVRAALLIRSGASNRLVLAAVAEDQDANQTPQVSLGSAVPAGTGLKDPIAMSWFSPYDLMVLDSSRIVEVPLAGGTAQLGPAPPGAESLTTDGATIVVGTAEHQICVSNRLAPAPTAITWRPRQPGAIPVYPG